MSTSISTENSADSLLRINLALNEMSINDHSVAGKLDRRLLLLLKIT